MICDGLSTKQKVTNQMHSCNKLEEKLNNNYSEEIETSLGICAIL